MYRSRLKGTVYSALHNCLSGIFDLNLHKIANPIAMGKSIQFANFFSKKTKIQQLKAVIAYVFIL